MVKNSISGFMYDSYFAIDSRDTNRERNGRPYFRPIINATRAPKNQPTKLATPVVKGPRNGATIGTKGSEVSGAITVVLNIINEKRTAPTNRCFCIRASNSASCTFKTKKVATLSSVITLSICIALKNSFLNFIN